MKKYIFPVAFFIVYISAIQAQEVYDTDPAQNGAAQVQESTEREEGVIDNCPRAPFNTEISPVGENKWVSKEAIDELKDSDQDKPPEIERIKDGFVSQNGSWGNVSWTGYDAERGIFVKIKGYTGRQEGILPKRSLQPDEFLRHIDEGVKRDEIVRILGATQSQQEQLACALNRVLARPPERRIFRMVFHMSSDYSIVYKGKTLRSDDILNANYCSSSTCKELFGVINSAFH